LTVAKTPKSPKSSQAQSDRDEALATISARDEADDSSEGRIDDEAPIGRRRDDDNPRSEERDAQRAGVEFVEDPRAAIASRQARRRVQEDEDDGEDQAVIISAADAAAGRTAPVDEDEEEEDEAETAPARTEQRQQPVRKVSLADLDPDAVVTMKVNGRDVEVRAGDLTTGASKYLAGDDYLRQGREFYDQARRSAAQPVATPSPTAATQPANQPATEGGEGNPPPKPGKTKAKVDAAQLVDLVDRIQAGSPEQGAEALAEALALIQQPEAEAENHGDDVRGLVAAEVEAQRFRDTVQAETNEALTLFTDPASPYTAIKDDPDLATLALSRLPRAVAAGLKTIGVTDENLAQLTPEEVVNAYHEARHGRLARPDGGFYPAFTQLPPLKEVVEGVAKQVVERFAPRPADSGNRGREDGADNRGTVVRRTQTRVERKSTLVAQPRSATSIRVDAREAGRPQVPVRDPSATVAKMAEARQGRTAL
jgi:hypothetical protein